MWQTFPSSSVFSFSSARLHVDFASKGWPRSSLKPTHVGVAQQQAQAKFP